MRASAILLLLCVLFSVPVGTGSAEQATDTASQEAAGASAEEQLEEFVPSEEISADRAISFPTDI
jgi:hypothetical protein